MEQSISERFGRERPLVLVLFHPDGRLPKNQSNPEEIPLEIKPSVTVDGLSISDEEEWRKFRQDAKARKKVFVTEGSVIARELGWSGKYPLIPAGESSISALKLWKDRVIYGSTSGDRSHLFMFDPSPEHEGPLNSVIDLGIIAEDESGVFCQGLTIASDDKVYMGTYFKDAQDGHIYVHDPELENTDLFLQFMIPSKIFQGEQIVDLGVPIPGEGIYTLAGLPTRCAVMSTMSFYVGYQRRRDSCLYSMSTNGRSYLSSKSQKTICRAPWQSLPKVLFMVPGQTVKYFALPWETSNFSSWIYGSRQAKGESTSTRSTVSSMAAMVRSMAAPKPMASYSVLIHIQRKSSV